MAISPKKAEVLLKNGQIVGVMTPEKGLRQWWFKMKNGKLYMCHGDDPTKAKHGGGYIGWNRYEKLPKSFKYKVYK